MRNSINYNYLYKIAYESGLILVGFKNGIPQFDGNELDINNFNQRIFNR